LHNQFKQKLYEEARKGKFAAGLFYKDENIIMLSQNPILALVDGGGMRGATLLYKSKYYWQESEYTQLLFVGNYVLFLYKLLKSFRYKDKNLRKFKVVELGIAGEVCMRGSFAYTPYTFRIAIGRQVVRKQGKYFLRLIFYIKAFEKDIIQFVDKIKIILSRSEAQKIEQEIKHKITTDTEWMTVEYASKFRKIQRWKRKRQAKRKR